METAESLNDSGVLLTGANRPDEAIRLFRQALRLEPENPLIWTNLGIAWHRAGNYGEAIASFFQALSFDGGMADPWFSLGLVHYETGDYVLAADCYRNALRRDGGNPGTWNNLGVLHFVTGNYGEARRCFEAALEIFPMHRDALFNLVDTCRETGDWRAAGEYGRILSELDGHTK